MVLCGCRGLPWDRTAGEIREVPPKGTVLPTGAGGIDDGTSVQATSLQMALPSGESDWLSQTRVVAIVNGEPVFASEILHRQAAALAAARQQLTPPQYRTLQGDLIRKQLKGYIDRRMMSQAMRNGLEQDRQEFLDAQLDKVFNEQELPQLLKGRQVQSVVALKRKLVEEGTTLEVLKEDFQQQQLAMEYLRQSAQPREDFSPSEMMAWYRSHVADFQTTPRVRWRQILVSNANYLDRDSALRVIEVAKSKLVGGEAFAAVARELSDGPVAAEGGLWDWTDKESFKDERISDALFRLPVGTSSRIFEGKGFFQLVVAVEREDGGAAKFETVQTQIEKRLAEENRVQEMERVVGELQLTAQITTVFDQPGKPFFPTGRAVTPGSSAPAAQDSQEARGLDLSPASSGADSPVRRQENK
jgi:parvulin-like peptidyl-prolyl isomerase